jgi:hypothetical protein
MTFISRYVTFNDTLHEIDEETPYHRFQPLIRHP